MISKLSVNKKIFFKLNIVYYLYLIYLSRCAQWTEAGFAFLATKTTKVTLWPSSFLSSLFQTVNFSIAARWRRSILAKYTFYSNLSDTSASSLNVWNLIHIHNACISPIALRASQPFPLLITNILTHFFPTNNHLFFTHLLKITVYWKDTERSDNTDTRSSELLPSARHILRETTHCESLALCLEC